MHIDVLPGTEDLQDVALTAVVGGDRRAGYQRLVNAMVPEEHCFPLQHLNPLRYVLRDMPPVRRLAELRKAPAVNLHEPMPMAPTTQDGPIWMKCPDQKAYRPPHMISHYRMSRFL
jgi:hypothetical protein